MPCVVEDHSALDIMQMTSVFRRVCHWPQLRSVALESAAWLRYFVKELRFIKSPGDLLNLHHKSPFLLQKLTCSRYDLSRLPLSIQIEITNYCNLSCTCCPRESLKREKGYMVMPLFRKIIDDAAASGIKRVHLYLHGEPLLHPNMIEMIGYVKAKRMGISLATNGMLLDRETGKAILSSGINNADHIMFSLLGFSKTVHEKIMRGVVHEKVVRNVFDFLELRKSLRINGPVIEAVMYQLADNAHERTNFVKFWRGIVDNVRWIDRVSEQYAQNGKGTCDTRSQTCKDLWQRITIFWNGDVTSCCADLNGESLIGNLRTQNITEVWQAEALTKIKTLHREKRFGEIHLCANCDWP